MKMYILIRETIPHGFAVLAAAHASLACYLKFKDTPEVSEWLSGPFYKAVCKVIMLLSFFGEMDFELPQKDAAAILALLKHY